MGEEVSVIEKHKKDRKQKSARKTLMKKIIILLVVVLIALPISAFTRTKPLGESPDYEMESSVQPYKYQYAEASTSDTSTPLDVLADPSHASFVNAKDTTDNPYGTTAGFIDKEGKQTILLTPTTAMHVADASGYNGMELSAQIDPAIASSSDGLTFNIQAVRADGGIANMYSEEMSSTTTINETIPLQDDIDVSYYKFSISNNKDQNDNGDWLLISSLTFSYDATTEFLKAAKAADTPDDFSLIDNRDTGRCWFEGVKETTDTPYGFNAGFIDDESIGGAVILLPNTAMWLGGTEEYSTLTLTYKIHPWVAKSSDGCVVNVDAVKDGESTSIYQKQISSTDEVTENIDISATNTCDYYRIYLTNTKDMNEDGDWLVFTDVELKK